MFASEVFYPGSVSEHPEGDRCAKRVEEIKEERVAIVEEGWYLIVGCGDKYPYSLGVLHTHFQRR